MRRALHSRIFYRKEFGLKKHAYDPVGINLGYGSVAEHEHGIFRLLKKFQVYNYILNNEPVLLQQPNILKEIDGSNITPVIGIQARKIHNHDYVHAVEYNDCYAIYGGLSMNHVKEYYSQNIPKELEYGQHDLSCAWNDSEFCILISDKSILDLFMNAFKNNDIMINDSYLHNKLRADGITVSIYSHIPMSVMKAFAKEDLEQQYIYKELNKLHIYELPALAGKTYYDIFTKLTRSGELIFYVNPQEQNKYRSCWCNVNDLYNWMDDKGIIFK